MAPDWALAVGAALPDDPVALVTVMATEGSAPRRAGARMAVTGGDSAGTIGGGALEHQAIGQARALLAQPPGSWRVQDYPLGPLLGQCCGGRVRLMIERLGDAAPGWVAPFSDGAAVATCLRDGAVERAVVDAADGALRWPGPPRGPLPVAGTRFIEPDDRAPRRPLLLFGAGHVGTAIAHLLPGLPLDLGWFDSRAEADRVGVSVQEAAALADCARAAPADAAMLILTHDHALDYRLAAAALEGAAIYVGLIGSTTKRARFLSRLATDGIDAARLTCPIGVPGITGKTPEVIAIAALAQILAIGETA